jgi:hypothetical protein
MIKLAQHLSKKPGAVQHQPQLHRVSAVGSRPLGTRNRAGGDVTRDQLREVARQHNEADAEAGRCTRYVEDAGLLANVGAAMRSTEQVEGAGNSGPSCEPFQQWRAFDLRNPDHVELIRDRNGGDAAER